MMKKGFTLIEMTVVIAIIGILATISVASFDKSLQRARDGRRRADLEQVRVALENYRADFKSYPSGTDWSALSVLTSGTSPYIKSLPADPKTGYSYFYNSSAGDYNLCAYLEDGLKTGDSGCAAAADCAAGKACNYGVKSP